MDREQLMGHGYIVERGLLQALRSELDELLIAGRKAFELTKDGRLRSLSAWQSNYVWVRVHAARGRAEREEHTPEVALKVVSASARRSALRGLEAVQAAVAAKAGHEAAAVADISFSWYPGRRWSPRRGISTESRGWYLLSRCTTWPRPSSSCHPKASSGRTRSR